MIFGKINNCPFSPESPAALLYDPAQRSLLSNHQTILVYLNVKKLLFF